MLSPSSHCGKCLLLICATLVSLCSTHAVSGWITDAVETELIAVLASDAPAAEKAIACKKLAIHGSEAAVPELARLLSDPQLASWSRIALEAIPGSVADDALHTAAESLDGLLLTGTVNSIGVRRQQGSAGLLVKFLDHADTQVACAAAVALGRIGGAEAATALTDRLDEERPAVRSAAAEGCVLCAEQWMDAGQLKESVALYDQVRAADLPGQRIVEATRGAILARGQDGIPLLLETLNSPDRKLFQLALATIREFPGNAVDQSLADMVPRAEADRAALIVQAMADRSETVVLSAILQAAQDGDRQVRRSAVDALRRVGNESCLEVLFAAAMEDDPDLSATARGSLAELSGDGVDAQIVKSLQSADGGRYQLLLELVGQRRIEAVEDVLQSLDHSSPDIRAAGLAALGETVDLPQLDILIGKVVSPDHAGDVPAATRALMTASTRMPDRDACAARLADALAEGSAESRVAVLEILAAVGGSRALQTLADAAISQRVELQDAASRLLGKWNSVDAAPVLLKLSKSAPAEKFRVRALRGYLGLARKFSMSDAERRDMCLQAINATQRAAERRLALDVLKLHPSPEGLDLAVRAMELPELRDDATMAVLVIARKVSSDGGDVRSLLKRAGLDAVELEIIRAEYGAGAQVRDVTEILQQQAENSPLIALDQSTYNASFGGDPAPGVVKKLTVRYRMNGTVGEATFSENEAIILPLLK